MSRRLSKRYLTPAEKYKCPLSPETQAIAEEELRETENSRSQALEALRNWMEQNPKFSAVRMGKNCSNSEIIFQIDSKIPFHVVLCTIYVYKK